MLSQRSSNRSWIQGRVDAENFQKTHSRKRTAGGPQNDGPAGKGNEVPSKMAIFGIYVRFLRGNKASSSWWLSPQLMVNCWFEAPWFGILGVHPSNNPFNKGILGIQTTNPNQQLTISWSHSSLNKIFRQNWEVFFPQVSGWLFPGIGWHWRGGAYP